MARPFADILREMQGGALYDDLGEAFAELLLKVLDERKAGELRLVLKVAPNSDRSVRISGDFAAKAPQAPRGASIFFVGEDGAARRDDPRQADIFSVRAVDDEPAAAAEGTTGKARNAKGK